jgi:hypothetical protein
MNIENNENILECEVNELLNCQVEENVKNKWAKVIYVGDRTKSLLNSFIKKNKLKKNLNAIKFIVENKSMLSLYEKEKETAINNFRKNVFKKYPKNGIYASNEEKIINEFNELKEVLKIKKNEELIYVFITVFNKVLKNKIKESETESETEITNESIVEELKVLKKEIEKIKSELNL